MTRRKTIRFALIAAVLLAGFVGYRTVVSGQGTEFKAKFDATIGLYPGSEVQVLGVRVGTVTAVEPTGGSVTVSMKPNKGQDVGANTNAVIVAPTLVSDRFVQLTEPYDGGAKLKDGDVLATSRTAVPVEIDDLYASLIDAGDRLGPDGANKDGALSDLLDVAAENLKGQGADINQMISEFGEATGTLSDTGDDFFATLANFKEFNDMLVANDRGVANVNRQFAAVTDYLAEDRQDLAEAVANLGDALGIVDDFIDDNRDNLKTSVENLLGPTQVLVKQKDSLEESVRLIPLLLQNYLKAYNPQQNSLDGRGNLNEVTIWADDGLSAQTSKSAPPVLLPGVGGN
ncbi:MCE family protein [Aeromicrobium sp. UC242_57]|uniref:MCE family protein n=1 Tax=Aeromicrobium sp. UC242_57 TaxID=3374624 RepID=UPI0037AB345E